MLRLKGDTHKEVPLENMCRLANYNIVVSDTANFFNGNSYSNPSYGIEVYTPNKGLNDLITPLRRFIYLPNYNTEIGIVSNLPNKERTICDFLMYPDELCASMYLLDALEGYEEEFGNFDKVYSMMETLGIPKEKLNHWLSNMWSGGNECADD